jgi:glucose/mannose transport system substrate-binding protein
MEIPVKKTLLACLLLGLSAQSPAATVEVLHYWTSESESAALEVLKQALAAKGDTWQDFTVKGGGGESAYSVLQTRMIAGNPPTAALMEGKFIQEWGALGFLSSPYTKEQTDAWDRVLPPMIQQFTKYHGEYVAVPVNNHRINWLWINPKPFKALHIPIPTTWDAFFVAADKLKAAGYIPLAHGGQAWQDATLFENILLGLEGGEFYRDVFERLDSKAITSDRMIHVLEQFRRLHDEIDPNSAGRPWHESVELLYSGKAAMMIMGDWAKGELMQMGAVPGKDFLCVATPGSEDYFIYGTDSFAILQQNGNASAIEAQRHLADVLMDPDFQRRFNQIKGSIPARTDIDMSSFDSCAQKAAKLFKTAGATDRLLPSMAHSMAVDVQTKEVFFRVLNDFFTHPDMSAKQAVTQLNTALIAVKGL